MDWDRDWVGLDRGLWTRSFRGLFMGLSFFFGAMGFPFFSFLCVFIFCYWGLRCSEPWGCLWTLLSISFIFFFSLWTLGHFLNIEHAIALLHMSTYIAERWHRAHGLCMCWGVEAPFVRNYTHVGHPKFALPKFASQSDIKMKEPPMILSAGHHVPALPTTCFKLQRDTFNVRGVVGRSLLSTKAGR